VADLPLRTGAEGGDDGESGEDEGGGRSSEHGAEGLGGGFADGGDRLKGKEKG
jgi:hypothetical protein